MRLHRLTVTAFGPFADAVEVDFDALSEAGLFLLSGPTGAGKSSVLDAVCFALYGEVPGDRSTARRLRCDVAPPGVPPRVELDATLAGRRFRIVRSPAWRRPKRRGDGETTEPAHVTLVELVDGEEVHLTSRLDEAGHLVGDLLGMSLAQFTQVALLPQGRFQDFLRARSEDRHTLLQQLFRTRRFHDIERWLRDHRVERRRESDAHAREVAGLLHRLGEAAATPYADDEHDLAAAAEDGTLAGWAADRRRHARAEARRCGTARQAAETVATATATAYDAGVALADRQRRHAGAVAELARLDALAAQVEARRAEVDAARRALPVTVLAPRLAAARARVAELAPAGGGGETDPSALAGHRSAVVAAERALAEAEALVPRDHERDRLSRRLVELTRRRDTLAEAVTVRTAARAALPLALAGARDRLAAATAATSAAAEEQQQVDGLVDRLAAHARAADRDAELTRARARRAEAVDQHQRLREVWLDLRERRLSGMAAEIALDLAVGASCPVCGSCDHPEPARPGPRSTTAGAERAARDAAETADVERLAADQVIPALEAQVVAERERAGADAPATLRARLAATRDRQRAAALLADGLESATSTLAGLEREAARVDAALGEAEAELATARTEHRLAETHLAEVDLDLRARLDGQPDVATLVRGRRQAVDLARAELGTAEARVTAAADLARLAEEAEALAREAGFADAAAARRAGLAPEALRAAEQQVREHDVARRSAADLAGTSDLAAAAAQPVPDLPGLATARDDAGAVARAAHADDRQAARCAARIDELATELGGALSAWAPVRRAYAVAAEVAGFAEGKAPDNRLQMRLSGYVLSWRLTQVVAAANVRLARMTDQRYALEHSPQRGAGESRGGLSLLVRDAWSGEARDPVTLSGGETFVVSLALALGLTDVVSGEAGGAEIGTLFVDEGFGSLDAETLDDVMDTLDELRDGGRVVGVVSHVSELRDRIPTRLQVDKARRGSTVSLVHAASW